MALAQGEWLSNGSSDRMLKHAIFLHVQPTSAPSLIGVVAPGLSRRSQPVCVVWMGGIDQTTGRSVEGTPLSSNAPTSRLSGFPCNRSLVFASSATPQSLVCCIHRLNPPWHCGLGETGTLRRLWPMSRPKVGKVDWQVPASAVFTASATATASSALREGR